MGFHQVGYAKIEVSNVHFNVLRTRILFLHQDIWLQHRQVFHRRLHWRLEPFLNKTQSNAFIIRCLLDRKEIPITLHIPVCFVICGHPVTLDSLMVPVNIKGIGFRLIQEIRSYFPLTKLFSGNVLFKFSISMFSCTLTSRFSDFCV